MQQTWCCTCYHAHPLTAPLPAPRRPPPTRTISRDFLVTARDVGVRRGGDPGPPGDGKAALDGLGASPSTSPEPKIALLGPIGTTAAASALDDSPAAAAAASTSRLLSSSLLRVERAPPPASPESPSFQTSPFSADSLGRGQGGDDPGGGGGGGRGSLADVLDPHSTRPLLVHVSDAKLLIDGAARDALWGAIEHLVVAFTTSPAAARRAQHKACMVRQIILFFLFRGGGPVVLAGIGGQACGRGLGVKRRRGKSWAMSVGRWSARECRAGGVH